MASIKKLLPAALLLLLVVVGFGPHGAEAAGSGPMALATGVVPCSTGRSINVAAVPVFPNAGVQMVCRGKVVAGATADGNGAFLINLGLATPAMLEPMLQNMCKLVVTTPLAACNESLADATGTLTAPLQVVGAGAGGLGGLISLIVQILEGLLGPILNIVPLPFSLV